MLKSKIELSEDYLVLKLKVVRSKPSHGLLFVTSQFYKIENFNNIYYTHKVQRAVEYETYLS